VDPFAPAKLGPLTLRNRIIKAATFEGRTPRRLVTDDLIDFHREVARGGAAMSTVAYCSVSREGSTDGHQVVLDRDTVPGLRRLTDAIHAEGAAACAQIGHSGPVADGRGTKAQPLAPSRRIAPMAMRFTKAATPDDLGRVRDDFRRGARVLAESGFDAIEVHLGHNYLLSSFLSPKLNRRRDAYGGDLESRARFPREVVRIVRETAPPHMAVTAKLNMSDGVRGGLEADESLEIARFLQRDGTLDAIELTGGSSLANPMYLFRGDAPRKEMAQILPQPLRTGFRLMAWRLLRRYPFGEAFFLPTARRFREALSTPLILLGGINRIDTIRSAIEEGFDFVAMGRALLREPDLPNRMRDGAAIEATCIHCNKCMPSIYTGTRCVVDTPRI
jgi:2,4-dienoyl-CoA reductase-like NADH-dependent reductase (Old Yellow Enzyme family)